MRVRTPQRVMVASAAAAGVLFARTTSAQASKEPDGWSRAFATLQAAVEAGQYSERSGDATLYRRTTLEGYAGPCALDLRNEAGIRNFRGHFSEQNFSEAVIPLATLRGSRRSDYGVMLSTGERFAVTSSRRTVDADGERTTPETERQTTAFSIYVDPRSDAHGDAMRALEEMQAMCRGYGSTAAAAGAGASDRAGDAGDPPRASEFPPGTVVTLGMLARRSAPTACQPVLDRSVASTTPGVVRFVNQSGTAVDIFWVNGEGERVRYTASLPPGMEVRQPTYEGHIWITQPLDGACSRAWRSIAGNSVVSIR